MQKYIILIVAVFIQLCLGAGYSWSTFVPALKQNFGLTTAQTQAIFGTGSLVATLLIFLGGRIQDRLGPRIPAVIGGIIFGGSYLLAGYSSRLVSDPAHIYRHLRPPGYGALLSLSYSLLS